MKKSLILFFGCILTIASNATTITQSGYFQVSCNGKEVSRHSTYRKALETAINQEGTCTITSPEYTVKNDPTPIIEVPLTTVTIEPPTTRVDGTPLDHSVEIHHYNLFASWNEGPFTKVWEGKSLEFRLSLFPGTWSFYVTATDIHGLESGPSNVQTKQVSLQSQ